MNKTILILLLIALVVPPCPGICVEPSKYPVKIIFDIAMDSDCDDVGALATLHML